MTQNKYVFCTGDFHKLLVKPCALNVLIKLLGQSDQKGWYAYKLKKEFGSNVGHMIRTVGFLEKLDLIKKTELVKPKVGKVTASRRIKVITLTDKGREVALKLYEIKEIMNDGTKRY